MGSEDTFGFFSNEGRNFLVYCFPKTVTNGIGALPPHTKRSRLLKKGNGWLIAIKQMP